MISAKEFIENAKSIGCEPELDGNWCKWSPPLPPEMLMEAVNLSDEIAEELRKKDA